MEKNGRPKIPEALSCYDKIDPLSQGYFRIWKGSKCGIQRDQSQCFTVYPVWDKIKFKHGYFYVWKNGKCGVYSRRGHRIIVPIWDKIEYAKPFFIVWKNGKCGVYSRNVFLVLEPKWDKVEYVKPYFRVWRNNKCGLYSHYSKSLNLEVKWDDIHLMKNGLFRVRKGNKFGVRAGNGLIHLKAEWNSIIPVYGKHTSYCYIVQKNGKYGIRDSSGSAILKTDADRIEVRDDYFRVRKYRTWVHFNPFEALYFGLSFEDIKALDIRLK